MRAIEFISLIFSVVAAFIAYFIGEALFKATYSVLPDEIVVGLYFALIGVIIIAVICFCVYRVSKLSKEIPVNNIFLKSMITFVGLVLIISFILGAGFEFIYSLGFNKNLSKDNYVVVIDNSGSMKHNDPNYERFTALNELFDLVKGNQKMGVYVFSDSNTNVIPIQKIDKSKLNEYQVLLEAYKVSSGGTNLMPALNNIIEYIETENLKGKTSIIVISDGECDINNNILNRYYKNQIPIHTIGVLTSPNSLMEISLQTQGNYYNISNLNDLKTTFNTIYNLKTNHILLSSRDTATSDSLAYIIMKLVFIALLVFVIKLMEFFIFDIKALRTAIMTQCILFSALASLIMEFIMQNTAINENFLRFLMILFASLIFTTYLIPKKSNLNNTSDLIDYDLISKSSKNGTSSSISDDNDEGRKSLK